MARARNRDTHIFTSLPFPNLRCPNTTNALVLSTLRFCQAGAFGLPTLTLLYYGRDKMFLKMAKLIDQENAESYGAFMSEVLNTSGTVSIGDVWFVHRDEPLEEFDQFDPRRNWKRGRVVDIKTDQFVVKLDTVCWSSAAALRPFWISWVIPLGLASAHAQTLTTTTCQQLRSVHQPPHPPSPPPPPPLSPLVAPLHRLTSLSSHLMHQNLSFKHEYQDNTVGDSGNVPFFS